MEKLKLENISFRYPNRSENALNNINLSLASGDFVALCGPSGCGKTTLLRLLKPKIAPHGSLLGEILLDGKPLSCLTHRQQSEELGFVFQNPETQVVTDKVWHELAFGAESLGLPSEEIRLRVAEIAAFFGIENLFRKNTAQLSGGQKQLLNLAAAMVLQPSVLILDEPCSQLDPIAANEFLQMVKRLNTQLGTTVIISEHRTQELIPMCSKLVVMDAGEILAQGPPETVGETLLSSGSTGFCTMPTAMQVWAAVSNGEPCPLSALQGQQWLEHFSQNHELAPLELPGYKEKSGETALRLQNVSFRYERDGAEILRSLNCSIPKGEIYAILGSNGAGKTTALSVMAGLLRPQSGKVIKSGKTALLPQDPRTLFLRPTLEEDLRYTLSELPISGQEKNARLEEAIRLCSLRGLLGSHPYDLSGGQQQLSALAKLLLVSPEILLLDEPTKGLDAFSKKKLSALLKELSNLDKTIVIVSHDVEFCAETATGCAMFFDGEIIGEAPPHSFFRQRSFYTTAANRMAQTVLPEAILTEEIIRACKGEVPTYLRHDDSALRPEGDEQLTAKPEQDLGAKRRNKPAKKSVISAIFIFLLIPLTILAGDLFSGERRYYFVSLLVVFEAMLPFLFVFEGRKPLARELVLIAVMCALAVAGRAAFFMVPQFKPTLAIIIIAGVCFGGETGFVVGALTALISNFFAGQGPWTPWQMFAMGLIGFLAGLLFAGERSNRRQRGKRLVLCVFGAAATLLIYGGIMNPAGVLISQANPGWQALIAAYALGLPFDLVHAASTGIFLWLLAPSLTEKLERVKIKFGVRLR